MIKNIRNIYDEKFQQDEKILEDKGKLVPLDDFIIQFALDHNNLEFLAYQYCWDLKITGDSLRKSNGEIDMFMKYIEKRLTLEQLTFMLKCRNYIQKVGALVTVKNDQNNSNDRNNEPTTEYFLSQDQLEPALRRWWKYRYNGQMLHLCIDAGVSRPAAHLDATKRYVSSYNVLSICVNEFKKDEINRLSELFGKSRLVPRLKPDDFVVFVKRIIPYVTKSDCDTFYRATVSKSFERKDISHDDFIKAFKSSSILYAKEEKVQQDIQIEELVSTIVDQYDQQKVTIDSILSHFEVQANKDSDHLSLRSLILDGRRCLSMLDHSLSIRNAPEACYNYTQLLYTLDLLFAEATPFNFFNCEATIELLECYVKENWLDSITESEEFQY